MSHDYQDDPSRYIEDQQPVRAAMMRAQEAERAANHAKADALAIEAKERAKAEEINRAVDWSVENNPQLQAARVGVTTNRVVSSRDVGVVASMDMVERTTVRVLGGIEVSYKQAKDMAEVGQISDREFRQAVSEAAASRGFLAPKSFR